MFWLFYFLRVIYATVGDCDGVYNGNRTEWSPIQCVIIRLINKIGRPCRGIPICLITSIITDRIGRHVVLLPIDHNHYNFLENVSLN